MRRRWIGLALGALTIISASFARAERYDRKLWIVEPVTPAAYPPA
jgi:hypothetical protein